MNKRQAERREKAADKGCTLRALIFGVVGALCIGLGSTYNDLVIKNSRLAPGT